MFYVASQLHESVERSKEVQLNPTHKLLESRYVGLLPYTAKADFSRIRKAN